MIVLSVHVFFFINRGYRYFSSSSKTSHLLIYHKIPKWYTIQDETREYNNFNLSNFTLDRYTFIYSLEYKNNFVI